MSQPFDTRLADDPPVQPDSVMPIVAGLVTGIALLLVLVGLGTLVPVVGAMVPAQASALAASTAVFLMVLALAGLAIRRATPKPAR